MDVRGAPDAHPIRLKKVPHAPGFGLFDAAEEKRDLPTDADNFYYSPTTGNLPGEHLSPLELVPAAAALIGEEAEDKLILDVAEEVLKTLREHENTSYPPEKRYFPEPPASSQQLPSPSLLLLGHIPESELADAPPLRLSPIPLPAQQHSTQPQYSAISHQGAYTPSPAPPSLRRQPLPYYTRVRDRWASDEAALADEQVLLHHQQHHHQHNHREQGLPADSSQAPAFEEDLGAAGADTEARSTERILMGGSGRGAPRSSPMTATAPLIPDAVPDSEPDSALLTHCTSPRLHALLGNLQMHHTEHGGYWADRWGRVRDAVVAAVAAEHERSDRERAGACIEADVCAAAPEARAVASVNGYFIPHAAEDAQSSYETNIAVSKKGVDSEMQPAPEANTQWRAEQLVKALIEQDRKQIRIPKDNGNSIGRFITTRVTLIFKKAKRGDECKKRNP